MSMHERIQRAEIKQTMRNNQARAEYMERLYSKGWTGYKAPVERNLMLDAAAMLPSLIAGLALLVMAVRWLMEQA
jgi:hypothetical protein